MSQGFSCIIQILQLDTPEHCDDSLIFIAYFICTSLSYIDTFDRQQKGIVCEC